jgi:hypothetical protein
MAVGCVFAAVANNTFYDKKLSVDRLAQSAQEQGVFVYQYCRIGYGDGGDDPHWVMDLG